MGQFDLIWSLNKLFAFLWILEDWILKLPFTIIWLAVFMCCGQEFCKMKVFFWCFQWYLIPSTPPGMGKQTLPHSSQLILIFVLQAVILSKLQSQLLMSTTLIFCPFLQLWEIILPPTPTLLDATECFVPVQNELIAWCCVLSGDEKCRTLSLEDD